MQAMFSGITNCLSCEFLLRERPNGGGVVFIRSLIVTILIYLAAIGLKERLQPNSTWTPDLTRFRLVIAETLPWFGAIFAVTYAGFYSRFSSQWSYLANLYNQILQVQAEAYLAKQSQVPVQQGAQSTAGASQDRDIMAIWRAAFIEDAEEVHLATKPIYAAVIQEMLERPHVEEYYVKYTPGGQDRLDALKRRINTVLECKKKEWQSRKRR